MPTQTTVIRKHEFSCRRSAGEAFEKVFYSIFFRNYAFFYKVYLVMDFSGKNQLCEIIFNMVLSDIYICGRFIDPPRLPLKSSNFRIFFIFLTILILLVPLSIRKHIGNSISSVIIIFYIFKNISTPVCV